MPECRKCRTELTEENWYASKRKENNRICKECDSTRAKEWRKAHPEKAKIYRTRTSRKAGHIPFNENKECTVYLGVHVAERVLSHVFKDVKVMPLCNPGYDFICNKGKKIDVKSSCLHKSGKWGFGIKHNTTADFFLCLAFDNRKALNPLHAWLIPGAKINHLKGTSIRQGTIHKWDAYRLDTTKISDCCDSMREPEP